MFWSTFYLSAFTIGGGYVIIPLMKKKFVDKLKWLNEREMLNLIVIAQSSPGAVAVNASIILGYKIAGFYGAILSILGTILPPFIILSIVSFFYTAVQSNIIFMIVLRGMQIGVAAVIFDVIVSLLQNLIKQKNVLGIIIAILAFIGNYFFNINLIFIIFICGLIGILFYSRKE